MNSLSTRGIQATLALVIAGGALASGVLSPGSARVAAQENASTSAPSETPESSVEGNDRYCHWLVDQVARRAQTSGCSPSIERSDEAFGRCTYHLSAVWTRDYPADARAQQHCLFDLDRAMTSGRAIRVPASCQVDRLFHDGNQAPRPFATLGRPRGAECRAENGDESFDANFRCAPSLTCASGRCVTTPVAEVSARALLCDVLLDLPLAIP